MRGLNTLLSGLVLLFALQVNATEFQKLEVERFDRDVLQYHGLTFPLW